jgi:hypothetical protein
VTKGKGWLGGTVVIDYHDRRAKIGAADDLTAILSDGKNMPLGALRSICLVHLDEA